MVSNLLNLPLEGGGASMQQVQPDYKTNCQTLIQAGGTEPCRATTLKGTVKAYVLDFQLSNASHHCSSSTLSTSFPETLSGCKSNDKPVNIPVETFHTEKIYDCMYEYIL